MNKPLLSPSLGEIREISCYLFFQAKKQHTTSTICIQIKTKNWQKQKQMNKNYIIILYYIFMLYNYILHQYYRKIMI